MAASRERLSVKIGEILWGRGRDARRVKPKTAWNRFCNLYKRVPRAFESWPKICEVASGQTDFSEAVLFSNSATHVILAEREDRNEIGALPNRELDEALSPLEREVGGTRVSA